MENIKYYLNKKRIISILIPLLLAVFCFYVGTFLPSIVKFDNEVNIEMNIIEVFIHNLLIAIILLLGSLSFGLISTILIGMNFFYIGLAFSSYSTTNSLNMAINKIIYHGIIEGFAIIIASSLGYYYLLNIKNLSLKFLVKNFILTLSLVIPLLLIASIIEVLISNKI